MKILVIHNTYQQPGGEQVAVQHEASILEGAGHQIVHYKRSNDEMKGLGRRAMLALPRQMTWAPDAIRDVKHLIATEKPDLAHIHNTHFMISPAVIHACVDMGVPVVQTLHNFRLICPAATFFRDGHVCEDCLHKPLPYPGVIHACFRDSRMETAVLAGSNSFHRYWGTYKRVSRFITPTAFTKQKLVEGGFDADRITVKPHFLAHDPGFDSTIASEDERFMLFVGRLSPEKGSRVLLEAWKRIPHIPLKVIGDGPLMAEAKAMVAANPGMKVELIGRIERDAVTDLMRRAYALVFPSECYETFGMVAVESFAVGTPVIASGHGAPAEIIKDNVDGYHFVPGDADALAEKVAMLWDNPDKQREMRQAARASFEQSYTASRNLTLLMAIYQQVLEA